MATTHIRHFFLFFIFGTSFYGSKCLLHEMGVGHQVVEAVNINMETAQAMADTLYPAAAAKRERYLENHPDADREWMEKTIKKVGR